MKGKKSEFWSKEDKDCDWDNRVEKKIKNVKKWETNIIKIM